jgi:hypothetical protein
VKYTDLANKVLLEVPGCPVFSIAQCLKDAAIEFCIKTDIWIQPIEDAIVPAGTNEIDLSPPAGAEINHVLGVYRNRGTTASPSYEKLSPVTPVDIFMAAGSGPARVYTMNDSDTITVAPTPSVSETLYVLYSLKPSQSSTSIPDYIANENSETLIKGALYRLQIQPQKVWSDPDRAGMNKILFDKALGIAIRKSKHGYAGGALSVAPREFV